MLKISEENLVLNSVKFAKEIVSGGTAPLTLEDYLKKITPAMSKETNRTYPYQVRIPKSINEMLRGDFEPKQVITITEPIMGPFGEMWFYDSTKGIPILCGYKNGDSRYNSDVILGDADIHSILAGATGQGKSVTF